MRSSGEDGFGYICIKIPEYVKQEIVAVHVSVHSLILNDFVDVNYLRV